jgi:hypothetical protein
MIRETVLCIAKLQQMSLPSEFKVNILLPEVDHQYARQTIIFRQQTTFLTGTVTAGYNNPCLDSMGNIKEHIRYPQNILNKQVEISLHNSVYIHLFRQLVTFSFQTQKTSTPPVRKRIFSGWHRLIRRMNLDEKIVGLQLNF